MNATNPISSRDANSGELSRERPDGRRERSRQSRARIVDALLDLVTHGEPSPSAEQVARRAGVGLRSVFRHFNDMDSLFGELSRALETAAEAHAVGPADDGSRADRLARLVERRSGFYEDFLPLFDAVGRRQLHGRSGRGRVGDVLRQRTALDLGPDLAEGERLDLADLLLSFEVWSRLRREQGLSAQASQHALVIALQRTLDAAPAATVQAA